LSKCKGEASSIFREEAKRNFFHQEKITFVLTKLIAMSNHRLVRSIPNLVFLGLIVTGVAVGWLTGAPLAGTLIGTGAGFIMMAIIRFATSKKKDRSGSAAEPDSE